MGDEHRAPKVRHVDFYADEWIAGTIALSEFERGIYITACALIYSHGGDIELDHLRSLCPSRGPRFNQALERLISLGKLISNGSLIGNKRASNELQKAFKRVSNASQNGAKGGRSNGLDQATGSNSSKANHQPPTTNHQPIEIDKSISPSSRALRTRDVNKEFAEVWVLYPRHVGKGAALKAYHRARKVADADMLREGIERLARARAGEDQQYTPHMATWLNQQRWLDGEPENERNGHDRFDYAKPSRPLTPELRQQYMAKRDAEEEIQGSRH